MNYTFWEDEIEKIYNNLPIEERKKLGRLAQITYGAKTTLKEAGSLINWANKKKIDIHYIPADILNRLLKDCGKV